MEHRMEPSSSTGATDGDPLRWHAWSGIAALTLLTTWPGIQQGLGRLPEEVTRIAISSQITSSGDLNPHWFGHPATLLIYLLAGLYKLILWITGIQDIRQLYLSNPSILFLSARIVARLAAVGSTILTFEFGKTLLPFRWALASALLLAINPLFTMHAHRARADHLLTIALLAGAWLLLRLQTKPSAQRAVLLSAFTGVAVTFKYSAASLMISWLISLVASGGMNWRSLVRCLKLVAIAACSAIIASPFLLLSWHEAWGGLGSEIVKDSTWEPHLNALLLINVLRYSLSALGVIILSIAAIRGLHHCWRVGPRGVQLMLANPVGNPVSSLSLVYIVYILGTFMASTYNATWLAPATPFLSIILMLELRNLQEYMDRRWRPVSGQIVVACLIGLMAWNQLNKLHSVSSMRQLPGTTSAAEAWLRMNVHPGDSVLLLQPTEAKEPAHFPRIQVPGVEIFISDQLGSITRVCQGEQGSHYATSLSLLSEPCYPRPIFRSISGQSLEQLSQRFDFVIYSNRLLLPKSKVVASLREFEIKSFTPPPSKVMLGYSENPFPQGDAGAWSAIQIFHKNTNGSLHLGGSN